jgi:peptide/nickel transport system permease protein
LVLVTFFIIFAVSLPLGYLAARRPGSLVDRGVTVLSSVFLSIPPFVTGLLLVMLLSLRLRWLPAVGYTPLGEGVVEWARHLVLPALALATASAAELTRQVRGSLVDTFEEDYIRTARAKGMSSRIVIWKHALKNAAPPVITVSGLQLTRLIGGTIIVERIFAMTGIGSLAYNAVLGRDLPLIQGLVLLTGVTVIVINVLVDLTNLAVSPRQRV